MCEILIDPPMALDELEVAAEMRAEGMEVEPTGLIRPMDLGGIIRALAANYSIRPDQVPGLLDGYLAASADMKDLICASGYMYQAPRPVKDLVPTAAAALAYMRKVQRPVTAHELAEHIYADAAESGIIRESAGQSACRDARKSGYDVRGAWGKIPGDDGKLVSVYQYTLHEEVGHV